jgi:ABC-type uncharacterized transport system substrate-binding protein
MAYLAPMARARTAYCRRPLAAAVAIAACLAASPVMAHPHAWIDLKMEALFNDKGEIVGLHENWLFDEGYTVFILDGLAKGDKNALSEAGLQNISLKIMHNLQPYAYFTHVFSAKTLQEIAGVEKPSAAMLGRRFDLDFTVKLRHPASASQVSYRVFDPTYYIEMLHIDGDNAIRLSGAPAGCKTHLVKASPSMEAIVRASALDQTQTTDTKLGALFAETMEISCP